MGAAVRRHAPRPPIGARTNIRCGYRGPWGGRGVASVLHCRPADRPRDPLHDRQPAAVRSAPARRDVRPHTAVGPTAADDAGGGPRRCRALAGPCHRCAPGGDGQPPRARPEHQSLLHRGPRRWSSALGPDGVTSALAVVEPDRARRPARRPLGTGPRPCARARPHCLRPCCSRVRGVEPGRRRRGATFSQEPDSSCLRLAPWPRPLVRSRACRAIQSRARSDVSDTSRPVSSSMRRMR